LRTLAGAVPPQDVRLLAELVTLNATHATCGAAELARLGG
jgi:hypothetical protein